VALVFFFSAEFLAKTRLGRRAAGQNLFGCGLFYTTVSFVCKHPERFFCRVCYGLVESCLKTEEFKGSAAVIREILLLCSG